MSHNIDEQVGLFVSHTLTALDFTKRNLDDSERKKRRDGTLITRSWPEERIFHEARALQLIHMETDIPVPDVLEVGRDNLGRAYLKTKRIHGIPLTDVSDQCRSPSSKGHTNTGRCDECSSIAQNKAEQFIKERVFPQLRKLKSPVTGLDGFVIPPPWILESDKRGHWDPLVTEESVHVFCHGDLSPSNIIVDPETLQVNGIIDWEHAGYFPAEFHIYATNIESYLDLYKDEDRIRKFVALIEPKRPE